MTAFYRQKHVTIDFLTKKQKKNNGEATQYYVKDGHKGIVSKEEWAATQQEFERRNASRKNHHFGHYGYGCETRPFSAKIICGECGCIYGRKAHQKRSQKTYWQCNTRCKKGPTACKAENMQEVMIHRVFLEAWNNIVWNQEKMEKHWTVLERKGTELERLRVKQMRELVKQGPLKEIVPELVQTVLESILVKGNGIFVVCFLDRTELQIRYAADND